MATPLRDTVTSLEKPNASIVYVTPGMAERWLGKNKVNRNLRDKKVSEFMRDMETGKWRLTGEAIKFGRSGDMLDGQHRCWAVIESGCTVPMFVIRGLEDDTQGVLDSGTSRTAADNLSMQGMKRAHLVASIARRRISITGFNSITNSEVYEYIAENPDIEEAAIIASRHANRCDITPSTMGLAAWLIADAHDWFTADEFFTAAAEKVGLAPGDPVLAMTAFFADTKLKRRRLDLTAQLSVIVRAFNARITGKSMRVVRVASSNGGAIPIPPVAS